MKRTEAAIEEGLPLKPLWMKSMRVEKRYRRKGGKGKQEGWTSPKRGDPQMKIAGPRAIEPANELEVDRRKSTGQHTSNEAVVGGRKELFRGRRRRKGSE